MTNLSLTNPGIPFLSPSSFVQANFVSELGHLVSEEAVTLTVPMTLFTIIPRDLKSFWGSLEIEREHRLGRPLGINEVVEKTDPLFVLINWTGENKLENHFFGQDPTLTPFDIYFFRKLGEKSSLDQAMEHYKYFDQDFLPVFKKKFKSEKALQLFESCQFEHVFFSKDVEIHLMQHFRSNQAYIAQWLGTTYFEWKILTRGGQDSEGPKKLLFNQEAIGLMKVRTGIKSMKLKYDSTEIEAGYMNS